ncbi:MAG: hypothetical protein U0Q11_02240 [Vicinamibacterales bacterium]
MTFIDTAIVDATEALCHRFQVLTGRTNVWLAIQLTNLSIVVYFVWAAALYVWSGDFALRVFMTLFCSGVLIVLMRTFFKVPIETSENEAYRRVAKGMRNPRRVRDAQLRISFLTLTVLLGGPVAFVFATLHSKLVLTAYLLTVLTTIVLYVLACDPLPPCPGKVREWVDNFARSRRIPA